MRYKLLLFLVLFGSTAQAAPDIQFNTIDILSDVNVSDPYFVQYDLLDKSLLYVNLSDLFWTILCNLIMNISLLCNHNQNLWLLSLRYTPRFKHMAGGVHLSYCHVTLAKLKCRRLIPCLLFTCSLLTCFAFAVFCGNYNITLLSLIFH